MTNYKKESKMRNQSLKLKLARVLYIFYHGCEYDYEYEVNNLLEGLNELIDYKSLYKLLDREEINDQQERWRHAP